MRLRRMRSIAMASALAAVASIPTPAAAGGTYATYGCWDTAAPGGWTPLDTGTAGVAYDYSCPTVDSNYASLGLHNWTGVGGWNPGAATGWGFAAPPGARVVGVMAQTQGPGHYETYANAWSRGLWDLDTGAWLATAPIQGGPGWMNIAATGLFSQRVALGLRCRASPCVAPAPGDPPKWISWSAFRRIVVTVRDDVPPVIAAATTPPSGWIGGGRHTVSFAAGDNVGVMWLEAVVDGQRLDYAARACFPAGYNTQPAPCASSIAPLSAVVDTAALSDGAHTLTLSAGDVVNNVGQQHYRFQVDREAPGTPRAIHVVGPAGWRNTNGFSISWTNPPEADTAPIERARYQLCPAGNAPYDESGCVSGEQTGPEISGLSNLAVPGDGSWTIRVTLVDAAGNHDEERQATLSGLMLDVEPPELAVALPGAPDPARLGVTARDAASGVASVGIDARRVGETVWRTLPVASDEGRYSSVIDDPALPDGAYELRVHARDRAGNDRVLTALPDGTPIRVTLPLRSATTLIAGRPKQVGSRSVLDERPWVGFGRSVSIGGRLTDASGKPLPGERIDVFEQAAGDGPWRFVVSVTAGRDGAFTYRAPAGTARSLRFVFDGTATVRPASDEVRLRVRAGVTLRSDRRTVDNGDSVVFRGRLLGGPVPDGGKLVLLQARTARGWRTFATPRTTRAGRWTHRYRFTATPSTARYRFRAVVPAESNYPYATGASRTLTVLVRGG